MIKLLEQSESKDQDLIPQDEFIKRNTEFFKKFGSELLGLTKLEVKIKLHGEQLSK